MKNFLLAVALLSIGTAAAAGADNLSLTAKAKAAKARQMVTEACYKDIDDGAAKEGLDEDQRQKLASTPLIKKLCECQGRKLENRLLKGLVIGPDTDFMSLYQKDRKECADAVLH
ncbi:hypothetical protein [Neisseria lactamica]|uniref:Secreted protein n=1 Tax=Neisseria lactamica TaxID=486 RepID=A0AAU8VER7_NEILA|nr:hypothetical protein [Neisseria lactamica]ARB04011.1 hypothetical protein B2G52_03155 [Neisseria lactamica]CBX22514.1 unnamed protein product [Neisseria lactamica Y92-1009]